MATVKKTRGSVLPYYGAAAVWIAWAAIRSVIITHHPEPWVRPRIRQRSLEIV